jgi:LmeA-like phospholipid-binding
VRKLLITLIVLAVLLVGADFVARYIAKDQIGEAVAQRLSLTAEPTVSIEGFPFLTQAIGGRYDAITIWLPAQSLGPVGGVTAGVELDDVRLPLSDAIGGRFTTLTIAQAFAEVRIPADSLGAALGLSDFKLSEGTNSLQFSATATVLGQRVPIAASINMELSGSELRLRNGNVSGAGVTLPPEVTGLLGTVVNVALPLGGLPFSVDRASARTDGTALIVDATVSNVSFAKLAG